MALKCPRHEIELTAASSGGIDYHYCRDCGGIWLVRDDLQKSLTEEIRFSKRTGNSDALTHDAACPSCKQTMQRQTLDTLGEFFARMAEAHHYRHHGRNSDTWYSD